MTNKNFVLELAEEYPKLTYSIDAGELLEMFRCVVSEVVSQTEQQRQVQSEQYLTRKQVAQMLAVDLSTLWRWSKDMYLQPVPIGGRRLYRSTDVERILQKGAV